jgi:hypothetical protein
MLRGFEDAVRLYEVRWQSWIRQGTWVRAQGALSHQAVVTVARVADWSCRGFVMPGVISGGWNGCRLEAYNFQT